MKKLLFILSALFLTLAATAQTQTEDEVYIGKGKIFGNFKRTGIIIPDVDKDIKPIVGQNSITGTVVGYCKKDCCYKKGSSSSIEVRTADGIITVGTSDYGFTVPKEIVGRTIIIEGKDAGQISGGRKRRGVKKDAQQDIQFTATGIKVID